MSIAPSQLARRLEGGLDQLLLRATAHEPGDRYPSAAAFAAALESGMFGGDQFSCD